MKPKDSALPSYSIPERYGARVLRSGDVRFIPPHLTGSPIVVTKWTPTAEELALLVAGGSLSIALLKYALPASAIHVSAPK
jgi:hypothetical protein